MVDDLSRVMMALHPQVEIVAGDNGWRAQTKFLPQPEHRGVDGWLHGGMAATILDHVGARCAAAALGEKVVTAKLDLRYRWPVVLAGGPYQVVAESAMPRHRTVRVAISLRDEQRELVGAKALFATLTSPSPLRPETHPA